MNTFNKAVILAFLASAAPAFAQQPVDPSEVPESVRNAQAEADRKRMEAINAQYPAKPIERPIPSVKSTDPDVQAMVKLLTGSFASAPSGETPALSLSSVVITVDGVGVDNAIYFELARADSAWAPFRQGVWQVWKKNGSLVVRQYDLTGVPPTFKAAVVGLWSVPDMFPVLKSSQLAPIADITLTSAGGNFSGTGAGPTMIDNAFEFSTSWVVTPESLSFTDRGTDASGKQVWGPAAGAAGPTLKRTATPVKVERRTGGIVVIDFVAPTATEPKIEEHSDAAGTAVFYSDAGNEFYNSNTPNPRTNAVEPFRWTAGSPQNLQGLNIGTLGMTVGTVRRLYIPASLGFGPRGYRAGNVPPNADLIVTLQAQYVGAPNPPAPMPTTPPADAPAGTKPAK